MSTESEHISSKNMEVLKESESVINDELNNNEMNPEAEKSFEILNPKYKSLNQGLDEKQNTLKERVNFENNKIAKVFPGRFEIPKLTSTQDDYLQKFEDTSSSDSAIDLNREVSSDSYDDDIFTQDDSIQNSKDNVERFFASFNFYKSKQIVTYTVDEIFFDHWCCKSKMDEAKLNNILKVWVSDNWDGLYDPPVWLTVDMFCMALTDEMSNTIKSEKIMEAKINLEMARLASTKVMPDILKKGAMKYLENLMQLTNMDSNDNFTEEKSLAIFMHILFKKMVDIYTEQNLKLFKLTNDLKRICDNAIQEWKNMIEFYKKISKSYIHYINLLQDLRSK